MIRLPSQLGCRGQVPRWGAGRSPALFAFFFLSAFPAYAFTLAVLGDSLTSGYDLPPEDAFPAQLERALHEEGYGDVTVINASISGNTVADGLARVDDVLAGNPDAVIIALGANDALRRVAPEKTKSDFSELLGRLRQAGVRVGILAVRAFPNMNPLQKEPFNAIFADAAATYDLPFHDDLLDDVLLNPKHNLPDHLHPNAAGVAVMVGTALPMVEEVITGKKSRWWWPF